MIRYTLGLRGMQEDEHGMFVLASEHFKEIKEYDELNVRNRHLAETLLKEQDDELDIKNKEIVKLKARVADLMEDAENEALDNLANRNRFGG